MVLKNKLDISDSLELAKVEEKLSKKKAVQLFESGYLDSLVAGTFESLAKIHKFLFEEIYKTIFVLFFTTIVFDMIIINI